MKVYIPQVVQELMELYVPVTERKDLYPGLSEQLEGFAKLNLLAFEQKRPLGYTLISNLHPDFLGKKAEDLTEASLDIDDFRLMAALEYGFDSWESVVQHPHQKAEPKLEMALDLFLSGEASSLKDLLNQFPELLKMRMPYGHEAGLIHYAGSNGVEMWRQRVPLNLPQMVQILLDAGADKSAKMKVYGGEYDTWTLYSSSTHPYEAGIDENIMKQLLT